MITDAKINETLKIGITNPPGFFWFEHLLFCKFGFAVVEANFVGENKIIGAVLWYESCILFLNDWNIKDLTKF